MSRANLCGLLQNDKAGLRSLEMPRKRADGRPVFHGGIGADLRKFREVRGWSVQQAVNAAHAKRHRALTVNRLRLLEEGRIQGPGADVLKAVAALYGLTYEMLAWRFVTANYGLTPEFVLPLLPDPLSEESEEFARTLDAQVPAGERIAVIDRLRKLAAALGIDLTPVQSA